MNGNILCIGGPLDKTVMAAPGSRRHLVAPYMGGEWCGPMTVEGRPTMSSPPTIEYRIRMLSLPLGGQQVRLRVALAPWLENDMDEVEARIRRHPEVRESLFEQAYLLSELERARAEAARAGDKVRRLQEQLQEVMNG